MTSTGLAKWRHKSQTSPSWIYIQLDIKQRKTILQLQTLETLETSSRENLD